MDKKKNLLSQIVNKPEFILNQLTELVIIYNIDRTINWMNNPAKEEFHPNEVEYQNKRCHDLWCISDSMCTICPIKSCIERDETIEVEKTLSNSRVFMVRGVPIKNDQNEILGAIGYCRDITHQKQNEGNLIRSNDELNFILENQNDLIIKLDGNFNFLYISKTYKEHFGHSIKDLLEKNIYRFVYIHDIPILEKVLNSLSIHNKNSYAEIRESTLIGIRWLGWSFKAVFNNDGQLESIVGIGRDITEKHHIEEQLKNKNKAYKEINQELQNQNLNYEKLTRELVKRNNEIQDLYLQLKESEERFRTMFMKHSSIMFLLNPETKEIINANDAALRFYGYSQHIFLGMNVNQVIVEQKEKNTYKPSKSVNKKSTPQGIRHKLKNGKIRDVEVYSMPIFIEKEAFEFSIVYDITERNRAQKKLALSEKKLWKANQAKDKFFSIIAHDLKNPFNALIGLSEFLINNFKKTEPERVFDIIRNMNQVSNQTYSLLEGLLQWARTQSGNLIVDITEIDIQKLVHENIKLFKETLRAKQITIINPNKEEIFAYGDQNMINTVIRNLLSNAIKFSYRGQSIIIEPIIKGNYALLSVIDQGKGMTPEEIKTIFSIESNVSTPGTEKEKGTGLGLIVCKEFIENCKGKIWAESRPEKGTRFTIRLRAVLK